MIHHLDDVRSGFDVHADAIIVGSGAGGAVAAANLAEAGLRTVVIEAGPQVTPAQMTHDAPMFLARHYWEGGLRFVGGTLPVPSMHGRCLGGSTLVNSAIMLKLPDWVRDEWIRDDHLDPLRGPALDASFARAFAGTSTAPTPMSVMGRRNQTSRDAMAATGLDSHPLPRAVKDCSGCGDCLIGCPEDRKQSMDRSYIPRAVAAGAQVFTCSEVLRVLTQGDRAVGVEGVVRAAEGRTPLARFTARAPIVILAASTLATPLILLRSRINPRRRVGATLYAHLSTGVFAIMDERVDPWVGATQGWGAFCDQIRGMKFESLWAPPSVLAVRWGGLGREFLESLDQIAHASVSCVVYRGRCKGRVRLRRDGTPSASLRFPDEEGRAVLLGAYRLARGYLKTGARFVSLGDIPGVPSQIHSLDQLDRLLTAPIRARHISMTGNHIFGSCRMSADPDRGVVDPLGRVHGVRGLHIYDASIFPTPSAVNPQATIMALSDLFSRRLAERDASPTASA